MLGFTNRSQDFKRDTKYGTNFNQQSFQPIIITNKAPHVVSQKKQQKAIQKVTLNKNPTNKNFNHQHHTKQFSRTKQSQSQENKNQWNTAGLIKGAFDKNLKQNELAAEQRRLRAQLKKQKQLMHQQIIVNQKKIGSKSIKMMKEKDEQIQYLRQMIQKEKQQKAKIDKMYQQRKKQIEREREELIELERRIQRQGIKQKRVIQEIKKISSPEKDNVNSRQLGKSQQRRPVNQHNSRENNNKIGSQRFQQPTQSQALHQKNALRQKQLQYLITQRQKCIKGLPSINYTPTLIPLLSKASYKIISTHVSQIVQLLIDDLLEQQVYTLEQIQLQQTKLKQQQKSKQLLNDYYTMLDNFVDQNQQISNKVGKYSTMNFTDLYKPKHYSQKQKVHGFKYDDPKKLIMRKITLEDIFDEDRIEEIENRKDRFIRFVTNFDQYKKPNVLMFEKCTEEIIDEAIQKLARELDKGSGEFVDIVFRNQFN